MATSSEIKTGWANPPTLDDLKGDLVSAKSTHEQHVTKVDTWLSNLRGDQQVKAKAGRSKVVPKVIRKQAEWRYASLSEPFLSTDELFNASPNTFEDKQAAIQNGQVLNYQFNHKLDKVRFIDEYVRACVDEGTVVVKIGWDYEEEVEEVEVPIMEPDGYGGEVQVGAELEDQVKVLRNQPIFEVCEYQNITIDPTCNGDISKAGFINHAFESSRSELKKDGKYKNIDKIQVGVADTMTDAEFSSRDVTDFKFKDEARQKFIVNEYHGYWDYDDNGIAQPIIAAWVGNTLIRLEENPFPFDALPFELVQYLPVRKSNYGEPDGELLEDNQRIIGAVTRGMVDILGRSANGQVGSRKDALDTVNARKYERGEDYKFNANVDPNQAFHMGKFPEIPRSALEMINLQNNEAEALTGVKAFSQGISGQSLGATATGIRSALDATSKRELGILRRLANGIVRIGHKVMQMNHVWLSDEEIIRVTNEPIQINRDDLAGEFDITLNVSTPEADSEKASGLEFMLQTLGNSMPFEMSQIVLADIARLRKMPELSKRITDFQQQPNPMAQKQAELEIALLQAKVFNEQNKGLENQADIALKEAKTSSEVAKARNLDSDSDQRDLDFIENENGTKRQHEADMKDLDSQYSIQNKAADAMINDEQSAGSTQNIRN